MKRILIPKSGQFNCLYIIIFLIFTAITFVVTKHSANVVTSKGVSAYLSLYWLSPRFFALIGENLMLLFGGILSVLGGALVPINVGRDSMSLIKTIYQLILLNILTLISSLILLLLLELIYIPLRGNIDIDLVKHSCEMFLAISMFLIFWSLIGLGLKITFNSALFSFVIGICFQILEIYVNIRYNPQLEIYLPTALSREIVVTQFPFWIPDSWANVKGVVVYASSSMLVDKYYREVTLGKYWVPIMLSYYLCIVFILPVVRIIFAKRTTNYDNN